ncbi:MAG: mitofilin family membrane protein, partial [Paracoccaceae bacterium]
PEAPPVAPEQPAQSPFVLREPLHDVQPEPQRQPDPIPDAVEVTEEKAADPIPPPRQTLMPPASQQSSGGSGFVALILGAAIGAGAGYVVQHYVLPRPVADTTAIEARLTTSEAEATALKAELAKLSERVDVPPPVDQTLLDRVAALESIEAPDLTGMSTQIATVEADISTRIAALETAMTALPTGTAAPSTGSIAPAALIALQAEVAALKAAKAEVPADLTSSLAEVEARITEAEARAAGLATQAQEIAAAATARAALGQIRGALDSGLPFGAALADLGDIQLPEALTATAETGVPTMAALQDRFPDAARAALEAALRANMGETWTDRVATYLRNQTGARSLTPREGTDPDAVLSRAEAAVATGDLPKALTEIAALPPEAQTALADWTATAQRRLDAQTALAELTTTLGR